MPLLVIIFFILLGITIVVIIVHVRKNQNVLSEFCTTDSDCAKSDVCIPNPQMRDKKQCFPANKLFCSAFPFTTLTKCRLDDKESCEMCLNDPKFTCVEVNKNKPYTWIQDGKTLYTPDSPTNYGWCLPNLINRDIQCNQFTSDYVLEEVGDGNYQWGCFCKYPNLFDHSNGDASGDCTLPRACGTLDGHGRLVVPTDKTCKVDSDCAITDVCQQRLSPSPCGYNSGGLQPVIDCSSTGSNCYCHAQWAKDVAGKVDPLTGRCECSPDLDFQCVKRSSDYFEFNCVQGFCNSGDPNQPWGVDDSGKCNQTQCYSQGDNKCICCKCPPGFLRCPDDVITNNKGLVNYCEHNGPTCIPDPCKTADVPDGHYDNKVGTCVCPGETNIVVEDENSPIGATCKNLCGKSNPCGGRGKCYVQNKQALCCDCVSPFTNVNDNTCTCSTQDGKVSLGGQCCHDSDCASSNCKDSCCGDQWGCTNPYKGTCVGIAPISPLSKCGTTCTPKKIGPVFCGDGGSSTCPQDSTCCQNSSGSWNCCPYLNGVCCGDNEHCCPSDHPKCDVKAGMCTQTDGSDPISWKTPTPP